MAKPLRIGIAIVASLVGLFLLLLAILSLTEWWPAVDETYTVSGGVPGAVPPALKIVTWNVGYAGLDSQTDFFMDGGKMSRGRSAEAVRENMAAITQVLRDHHPDIALLQEVDIEAARSYGIPEKAQLQQSFSEYASVFTQNYKVPFVPVPPSHPMGGAQSGIFALSRTQPLEAHGLRLPGRQAWPNRLFNLKRTLSVLRFAAPNGKQLVVVNAHLTAFDSVGNMRQLESAMVREKVLAEQQAGNYVIVGGDWNSALPGKATPPCNKDQDDRSWLIDMPQDFAPAGWNWAVGTNAPTVRTLGAPMNAKTTCNAYIDGFLLSPGIELKRVATVDLGFLHGDHNPVEMEIVLH